MNMEYDTDFGVYSWVIETVGENKILCRAPKNLEMALLTGVSTGQVAAVTARGEACCQGQNVMDKQAAFSTTGDGEELVS